MAVLKLKPACKDYLWGGTRLMKEFGKAFAGERLAETWELSCHPHTHCQAPLLSSLFPLTQLQDVATVCPSCRSVLP